MPKKHAPSYQATKPQPISHVSLASRSTTTSAEGSRPETVNDRLAQLRASQRTAVRSPPVLSERGQRLLTQHTRGARWIAGPPPPPSWIDPGTIAPGLEASRHAPRKAGDEQNNDGLPYDPPPLLPDQPLPEPRSLRAAAMRVLARTFSRQIEARSWLVYELTARMKCELIAMMISERPSISGALDEETLQYLFGPLQEEDGSWVSGGEGITHLSLGPVMGNGTDYKHLAKNLRQSHPIAEDEIPDSWDDTADASVDDTTDFIPKSLWLPLLPSLTHLSLARPHYPSWPSLLELGELDCLSHLTHLDLSYWPAPHLRLQHHEGRLTTLQAELIPSLESGESEQIRILNRLGKACRNLTWLGLEGCESWLHCLTVQLQRPVQRSRSRFDMDMDGSSRKDDFIRVDWTGVWRGLKAIRVIHTWAPTKPGEESLFRQWWKYEKEVRNMEILVANWRLEESGLPPVKFEKTPVASWVDLEIRTLDSSQALIHWKNKALGS